MEDKVMLFFRFGKRCIKKIKTCFGVAVYLRSFNLYALLLQYL